MRTPPMTSAAFAKAEILRLSRSFFQQTLLQLLLALDTMPRPRHGFQTLRVDFLAAINALAKTTFANARQRLLYHLEQLPFVVALAKQKFLVVGTRCTVGNILS